MADWIKSKDYIVINGISSDTVHIYIDTPPIPPKAEKKTQTIVIPGREDVITTNGEYEDITITINGYVFDRDYDPGDVYRWLEVAKTLKTSLSADYYYKVKKVMGVNPNYLGNGKYRLELQFLCSPYKYSVENEKHEETSKTFTISNEGTIYSQPTYIVYGNGEIKIRAADDENTITVYNVNGKATIDCERLVAYDDNKNIMMTSGIFPFLNAGNNNIVITGDVSKVEYYTNSRWF